MNGYELAKGLSEKVDMYRRETGCLPAAIEVSSEELELLRQTFRPPTHSTMLFGVPVQISPATPVGGRLKPAHNILKEG